MIAAPRTAAAASKARSREDSARVVRASETLAQSANPPASALNEAPL